MQTLKCEMCGSNDLVKQDGFFVCQNCGCKYTLEEAKKMMIEGTVDVQGTVKVDNSAFVQKYLANARRAMDKTGWDEAEKYYNMVEQNVPDNIEALFFSAYAKLRKGLYDINSSDNAPARDVLIKSMTVINDYYDTTTEDKEAVLKKIDFYIKQLATEKCVRYNGTFGPTDSRLVPKFYNVIAKAFQEELKQISQKHDDQYIKDLLAGIKIQNEGCYVATCVYGSYDCPEVWTLRRYRDQTLGSTRRGRAFIKLYYAISPKLVKMFGKTKWFKKMWKGKLDRMVKKLNDSGVENTPYQDKNWN